MRRRQLSRSAGQRPVGARSKGWQRRLSQHPQWRVQVPRLSRMPLQASPHAPAAAPAAPPPLPLGLQQQLQQGHLVILWLSKVLVLVVSSAHAAQLQRRRLLRSSSRLSLRALTLAKASAQGGARRKAKKQNVVMPVAQICVGMSKRQCIFVNMGT